MKLLAVDVESTTFNQGNPFDKRNTLVCISLYDGRKAECVRSDPAGIRYVNSAIANCSAVLGFNFKFDLHWLTKYGIIVDKPIIDVQNVEFILSRQERRFPSLEEVSARRLNKHKQDIVRIDWWERGFNTDQIPWEILSEYAKTDVILTYECYMDQQKYIKPHQRALISVVNQDLVGFQEMEANGQRYDREGSLAKAAELHKEIEDIQKELFGHHETPNFNWNSNRHLSSLLYGGIISYIYKEPIGIFKGGKQKGEVKYGKRVKEFHLPRLFEPIKGTELLTNNSEQKYWSTDEETLLKLKGGNKKLIQGILKMKELQTSISRYLEGIPEKQVEGNYDQNYVYSQFSQVTANTGRIASSKPNTQNLDDNVSQFFITRY